MANGLRRLEIKIDSGFTNAAVLLRELKTTMNQNSSLQHSDMLALTNRQNVYESLTEMNVESLFCLFECSKAEQEV